MSLTTFFKRINSCKTNNEMKKLLLSAVVLCTATVMNALPVQGYTDKPEAAATLPVKLNPNFEFVNTMPASRGLTVDLIMEPEGTLKDYTMKGVGISNTTGGLTNSTMQGATNIVWGEDNKVYIHNPLGAFRYGYAEGTLSADGKTIRVQLPQAIAAMRNVTIDDEDYYPVNLSVMNCTSTPEELANGEGRYEAETDPEKNYIEYSVDENGVISQIYPYKEAFDMDESGAWPMPLFPETMLSCYLSIPKSIYEGGTDETVKDYWFGYANLNQQFTPVPNDLIYYDIPEDLEWDSNWSLTGGYNPTLIDGAIQGDKIYFKNFNYMIPDAVVVGEINGNTVTFKDRQCMGICEMDNRYILFNGVNYGVTINDWGYEQLSFELSYEDVVMSYDAETKTLVQQGENKGFILNSLIDDIYYYSYACNPTIRYQSDELLCAAPENPQTPMWSDYSEWYEGYRYCLFVNFPNMNVNGALLEASDMAYRVFMNHEDEPFIFDATEYELPEDMEWLGATFIVPNQYICGYGNAAQVLFFETGYTAVGVQTRYSAPDGKDYLSDIVWYDIPDDGIAAIDADRTVAAETMFDITGRRVVNPSAGQMVIKVIRYTDGTIKTAKTVF